MTKNQKKALKKKAKRKKAKGEGGGGEGGKQGDVGGEDGSDEEVESVAALNPPGTDADAPEDAGVGRNGMPEVHESQLESGSAAMPATLQAGPSPQVIVQPGLTEEQLTSASCKLVDFGNACWTYKQFTTDVQTRQYRYELALMFKAVKVCPPEGSC